MKTLGGEDFDLFAESGADGVEYYSGNTPDGMLIAFGGQGVVGIPTIIFDVNDKKGPNVVGRDIHGIYIIDNMVTPMYSRPYLIKIILLPCSNEIVLQSAMMILPCCIV